MRGHVTRRGPSRPGGSPRARPWAFILEIGVGPDGRRRQLQRSGFGTKRAAQEALQAEIQRRGSGVIVDAKRLTVGDFLTERWLPGLSRLRPSTLRSYTHHVRSYLVPLLGARQLRELSTPDVNHLTAHLSRPQQRGGAGLKPASVRLVHATLRAALADAVRWGLLPVNVAVGAELPRRRRTEMTVWTAEQLRQFLDRTTDDELGPLYALIAHTGLRRGEAVGLRWRQVDLRLGRLVVDHQLIDNGYTQVLSGEPKSQRGRRILALAPSTVALLEQQRQRQARRAVALADGPTYVFTHQDGQPHHPDFVTRHFQRLAKRHGLPVIRLHDLRHTHATLGLAAGVPAKVMSDRLGHSSVLLTLDTYSHVTPALDAGAAQLIARLIAGEPGTPRELRDPKVTHNPIKDAEES